MKNIPTAEEFQNNYKSHIGKRNLASPFSTGEVNEMLIEFAKLHVEKALQTASENAISKVLYEQLPVFDSDNSIWVDKNSILNSYPLTNIK